MNRNLWKNIAKNAGRHELAAGLSVVGVALCFATSRRVYYSNNHEGPRDEPSVQDVEEAIRYRRCVMDEQVVRKRRYNSSNRNRSAAQVCDSYISWMSQSSMDQIMDSYHEYMEFE